MHIVCTVNVTMETLDIQHVWNGLGKDKPAMKKSEKKHKSKFFVSFKNKDNLSMWLIHMAA